MRNQVLSIEKMEHLKELGVDISKASMVWIKPRPNNDDYILTTHTLGCYEYKSPIPTFTLQDMLVMIKEVFAIHISIYQDEIFLTLQKIEGFVEFEHSSNYLIECAYEALCWCAKNNYIGGKNEERD